MAETRIRKRMSTRTRRVQDEPAGGEAAETTDTTETTTATAPPTPAPVAVPAPAHVMVAQSDEELEAETQQRYEQAKRSELTVRDLQKLETEALQKMAAEEKIEKIENLSRQKLIFKSLER